MKTRKVMKRILSLLMAMCLLFAMTVIVNARDGNGNSYVRDDRTGTLLIKVGVTDKDDSSKIHYVKSGTGFLVNDTTLITCAHVVNFDDEDLKAIQENLEMSEKQANEHKVIRVFLYRDDFYVATITAESDNADIAVLGLKESIKNRTYLKIRTSGVVSTEPCFTLGFPFLVGAVDDQELNTTEDVTINGGMINKVTEVNSIKYIVHDAKTLEGNSGGPVVDQMGNVIGVSQAYTSQSGFSADYNYSIAIEEVTNLLDPRGISYTVVDESAEEIQEQAEQEESGSNSTTGVTGVEPSVNKTALQNAIKTANDIDTSGWSNEQIQKRDDAVKEANEVLNNASATQEQVDAAAETLTNKVDEIKKEAEKNQKNNQMFMIIGIVAAAVIALIIIFIIINGNSKKKKQAAAASRPAVPPVAPVNPAVPPVSPVVPPVSPVVPPAPPAGGPGTTVLNAGAGETTVLNAGAGETTVLSSAVNLGTLTKAKTGDVIAINKETFVIGKERNSVDYCISDNTSVSRKHAIISSHGGAVYIKDNKSTNGTSVNDVRVSPGQEAKLADGDKIRISDEEFIYHEVSFF